MAETTLKLAAATPPKLTAVAPVKLDPKIITLAPGAPLVGAKPLIIAVESTLKLALLVAVPPGVITLIGPLPALAGTVVVICVDELTVKNASTPLNLTLETPLKFVPNIITDVPTMPLVGLKPLMAGVAIIVNDVALVITPPGEVTLIGPLVAPAGTVALICVSETILKVEAIAPLKLTAVTLVKLEPKIETLLPAGPLVGLKPLIVVVGITLKFFALLATPLGATTVIGPEVAPAGTIAVI